MISVGQYIFKYFIKPVVAYVQKVVVPISQYRSGVTACVITLTLYPHLGLYCLFIRETRLTPQAVQREYDLLKSFSGYEETCCLENIEWILGK